MDSVKDEAKAVALFIEAAEGGLPKARNYGLQSNMMALITSDWVKRCQSTLSGPKPGFVVFSGDAAAG